MAINCICYTFSVFEDKIKVSIGPMMIGGCLDRFSRGVRVYNGLYGYIDEVNIYVLLSWKYKSYKRQSVI